MRNCKYCNNTFIHKDKRALFCCKKCKYTFDNLATFSRIAEAKKMIKVENLENEEWRPIPNYEGFYEVSNLSRVKRLWHEYKTIRGDSVIRLSNPEYILKGNINKWGYHKVLLRKEGKATPHLVHRLVASSFISNTENYETVNHMDCNKLNNTVENLEWCTRNSNTAHAWENGLYTNFTSKIVICTQSKKEWESVKSAAIELNIRPQTLARMLRGDRKNNTSLIYKPNPATLKETEV